MTSRGSRGRLASALLTATVLGLLASALPADAHQAGPAGRPVASPAARGPRLELLGEARLPTGTQFRDTEVGGLSGLQYDAARDVYYALSDDPGVIDPVRVYTLDIEVADGRLDDGDVTVRDVTTLTAPDGQPFAPGSLDPEGLAVTRDGTFIVTSEGIAVRQVPPFVREYDTDGRQLRELPLPATFRPNVEGTRGVRQNLGFESAVVTRDGQFLLTATENALVQDGPAAALSHGSRSRVLRYHLQTGRLDRQAAYETDPVAHEPQPSDAFRVNGLVDLLPVDSTHVLALERSFSVGVGNSVKIYGVSLAGATNVNGVESLEGRDVRAVRKVLVADLDELGITLDNLEGMTFGPRLPDGRRSLILVSDNNFSPDAVTQVLLFAVS